MDEELLEPVGEKLKTGISKNTLKYIAIIAMVIDHTAHAFAPSGSWLYVVMRFIGRITGPVMFYAAAEGYRQTKNINRYMLRLAIFALISYFPFVFFMAGGQLHDLSFIRLNVIYTIFLGVTAIRIRHEIKNPVFKVLLIAGLFVFSIPGDWGTTGMIIMLVFDYFYGDFRNQAFAYCVVVLLGSGIINTGVNLLYTLIYTGNAGTGNYLMNTINAGMFLPIILLYFYNGQKGRGGRFAKWVFYVFYPLHLLLLGILKYFVG